MATMIFIKKHGANSVNVILGHVSERKPPVVAGAYSIYRFNHSNVRKHKPRDSYK